MWDTTPHRHVVAMDDLLAGLQRFEVRRNAARRIARRLQRAESLPIEQREKARFDAKNDAKRELAQWSPVHYHDGVDKRGSEGVHHVSCLVFDFEKGLQIPEASSRWEDTFHVVHTTWSHTPESHRFRLVVPLARPVLAADWRVFWEWAAARAGRGVDPTGKPEGTMFALPAVPDPAAPHYARVHAGALLDPVLDGPLDRVATAPPAAPRTPSHFCDGEPGKEYVTGTDDPTWLGEPLGDDDLDFDLF